MARNSSKSQTCDILVIGGGPAGSTISALLVEKGWNVIVIEKDRHPRFHIGESLLPRNMLLFGRLGILEDVKNISVTKYAADISHSHGNGYKRFEFKEVDTDLPTSFQVNRAAFDKLLLDNARAKGVKVLQGTTAKDISIDDERGVTVETVNDKDKKATWQAKFLVDATGRDAVLSSQLKLKVRDQQHNTAAIYAHFKGVERRAGMDEGNTSIIWFKHGWLWTIAQPNGNDSVGIVCSADYLRTRKTSLKQFLLDTIETCPQVAKRMVNAKLVTEAYVAGNYSYKSQAMYGNRFLLIGDAYAFLDPILSSGVYMAMETGARGADVIDACLKDPDNKETYFAKNARVINRGIDRFSWFIYRFNDAPIQDLFLSPINLFNVRQSVIQVLAGDVFRPFSGGIGLYLFKITYYFGIMFRRKAPRSGKMRE